MTIDVEKMCVMYYTDPKEVIHITYCQTPFIPTLEENSLLFLLQQCQSYTFHGERQNICDESQLFLYIFFTKRFKLFISLSDLPKSFDGIPHRQKYLSARLNLSIWFVCGSEFLNHYPILLLLLQNILMIEYFSKTVENVLSFPHEPPNIIIQNIWILYA